MFKQVLETARAKGATFVYYKGLGSVWTVVDTRDEAIIAQVDALGLALVAAGIDRLKKSLYDFDAAHFVCGTVDQLEG